MTEDLYDYVRQSLKGRRSLWRQMATDLAPDVSYSMISKIGSGEYKSSPSYNKLQAMAAYLRSIESVQ